MGKVDHLLNIVEPSVVLFWALGNVLANTATPFTARWHHSTAIHKACPYMGIFGLILNEDAPDPPSPPRPILGSDLRFGRGCVNIQLLISSHVKSGVLQIKTTTFLSIKSFLHQSGGSEYVQ